MFRGIFGTKSDRPPPPKNQIEVVCPACGAGQYEPRLVVSTICKSCGAHLNIERKKVTASSTRPGATQPGPKIKSTASPRPAVDEQRSRDVKPAAAPAKVQQIKAADIVAPVPEEPVGFGAFLKQQAAPEPKPEPERVPPATPEPAPAPTPAPTPAPSSAPAPPLPIPAQPPVVAVHPEVERRPHGYSPAPTPAPAPMSASTLQKMKDQGMYRNQYFKDAECFECGHKFKVSRSSRSASCPQCGAPIAMEDVEINMSSTQAIKTRGDVLIRKRGHLSAHSVQCKDLRCYGQLEANVQASGDAVFRTTGTITGEVRCHRFVIEKDADVAFVNTVHADEVEVQARVTGTIIANGPVFIGSNGAVNGDVTARSVSIDPGGELNGAMNILRSKPIAVKPLAEPKPEASA